jgi:hypothetical protein
VIRLERHSFAVRSTGRQDEILWRDPEQDRPESDAVGNGITHDRHHAGCCTAVDDRCPGGVGRARDARADHCDRASLGLGTQTIGSTEYGDDRTTAMRREAELVEKARRIRVVVGHDERRAVSVLELDFGARERTLVRA